MTKEEALFKVEGLLTYYLPVEDYDTVVEIMKALKQQPATEVDCISRDAAKNAIINYKYSDRFCEEHNINTSINAGMALIALSDLPSVTPQPRIGHWIEHQHEWGDNWQYSKYECSDCHNWANFDDDFCPNCGVKMVESEE